MLGLTVWSKQADMLTLVADHHLSAVRAGRKVSKSTTIAALALWAADAAARPVLLTSSSYMQLKRIVWAEVRARARAANLPIVIPLDPHTGIDFPSGGTITGTSVDKAVNIQGFSGANALFLVDEAAGVRRETIEALEGNIAGGGGLAMFGNPNLTSGPFYDAFTRREAYATLRVSSRESPNVTGEASIPGLATREWVERSEREYGADSAFVQVHVDGVFPTSGDTAVVTLAMVDAARAAWQPDADPDAPLRVGVDPAYTGADRSVIVATRGNHAFPPVELTRMDTQEVAGAAIQYALEHARGEKPVVNVDVIGIGAGVYDALKREKRIVANPINVANAATSRPAEGGYRKLRDQMWFALRDWLAEGGTLPPDQPSLYDELIAPNYSFDAQGRYVVESKDQLRERLGRSPDYADALALAAYAPPQRHTNVGLGGLSGGSIWRGA